MGTTADKLSKLLNTKQEIKQAIKNKGVDIDDSTKFADYPSKIGSIMTGDNESVWNMFTNNGKRMEYLFYSCKMSSLDISHLDTSQATNMCFMFYFCNNLTTLDVSNFDTSKVTDMSSMFGGCSGLTTLDVSNFNTSNVTDMSFMFNYCSGLTTITGLQNFDFTKAITLGGMFGYCDSLTSLDLSTWDVEKFKSSYQFQDIINNCNSLADFYPPKNINTDMRLDHSTALSHDSLMRIINNLMTTTSTKKLTLGATNLAKLTDEEKAIATGKGWTVK